MQPMRTRKTRRPPRKPPRRGRLEACPTLPPRNRRTIPFPLKRPRRPPRPPPRRDRLEACPTLAPCPTPARTFSPAASPRLSRRNWAGRSSKRRSRSWTPRLRRRNRCGMRSACAGRTGGRPNSACGISAGSTKRPRATRAAIRSRNSWRPSAPMPRRACRNPSAPRSRNGCTPSPRPSPPPC